LKRRQDVDGLGLIINDARVGTGIVGAKRIHVVRAFGLAGYGDPILHPLISGVSDQARNDRA